jgi:hypothetical protein
MKRFKHLCAAFALTFAFALHVLAGEISTGPGAAPPTPSPSAAVRAGETADETALGSFAEIELRLLESVLSLS